MAVMVEYKDRDVLEAARARIAEVFKRFGRVVVSVSSGKDSTVLYHLAMDEAQARGRKVEVFFLDQEAEYQSSVDIIVETMSHPCAVPRWYQVPLRMTNATSHVERYLHAWGPGEEWIRDKHQLAIHDAPGAPARFYEFFPWLEQQATEPTAFLIGLRSKESLNRFRAVTNNPGYDGISWSTQTKSPHSWRFYPLYDWTFGDVWKLIADRSLRYNRVYDWMFAKHGVNMSTMRVSNLIHERSYKALADLQEFEPETYDRLVRRLGGVHCAALYCKETTLMAVQELPARWRSWREYRDYLLETTPDTGRFVRRFAKQGTTEDIYRQQVKQVLLNDHENNLPLLRGMSEQTRRTWWERL